MRLTSLCVVAFAVGVNTAAPAIAEPAVCSAIQRGDTAELISWRMTGGAHNKDAPWFHIVDATSRVVAKSEYRRIHPGWRACVPSSRLSVEWRRQHRLASVTGVAAGATAPGRPATGEMLLTWAAVVAAGAMFGVAVVAVMGLPHAGLRYVQRRQAIVSAMQQFGERFVCEFERPLTTPGCDERAVESRLRLIPRRQRLEISIAPTGRRRYPNLSDHRRNVMYDAERIALLLRDERFVGGQLSRDGKWVVIACQFKFRPEQRGRK